MSENQRQNPRIGVNQEFESIDAFLSEYVTNISRGGIFIRSKNPLPVGTRVQLRFTVILDDIETIEGEGEVVRVEQTPGNTGMGVSFKQLTPASQRIVDQLMAERDARLAVIEEE